MTQVTQSTSMKRAYFSMTFNDFSLEQRLRRLLITHILFNGIQWLFSLEQIYESLLCHLCQILPHFLKRIYRNLISEELIEESLEFGKYFFYKKVLRKGARFDTSDTEYFYETYILFNDIQWLFFRTGLRPFTITTHVIQWYSMTFL